MSVGHLASLYNYDMEQYHKAEELYLRSIKIGRKLFGPSYSGLEYDYRGLIQVNIQRGGRVYFVIFSLQDYAMTRNFEKCVEFRRTLEEWKISCDTKDAEQVGY